MFDSVTIQQPYTHSSSVLGHGAGRHRGLPSEEDGLVRPEVAMVGYGRHRRFSHAARVRRGVDLRKRRIVDDERFEREVLTLLGPVYQAALHLTGSPDGAQALVLSTFERAYVSFPTTRPGVDLESWLCRILVAAYFDADGPERSEQPAAAIHAGQDTADIASLGTAVTTDVHKELQPC
jgi:hypothetical protein